MKPLFSLILFALIPLIALAVAPVSTKRWVYTSTSVSTGTHVVLLSTVPKNGITKAEIFDSSGQTMRLYGMSAATATVSNVLVPPGGNGVIDFAVPEGGAVWLEAISAVSTAGEIDINFYK